MNIEFNTSFSNWNITENKTLRCWRARLGTNNIICCECVATIETLFIPLFFFLCSKSCDNGRCCLWNNKLNICQAWIKPFRRRRDFCSKDFLFERLFVRKTFCSKDFLLERLFVRKNFCWKEFLLERIFVRINLC
jgi:hypothetical protein